MLYMTTPTTLLEAALFEAHDADLARVAMRTARIFKPDPTDTSVTPAWSELRTKGGVPGSGVSA